MIRRTWKRMALVVTPIILVAILAAADAQADPVLPGITNGDFHLYSGVTPGTNGDYFNSVHPTGWTSAASGRLGSLIFVTNANGINNGIYLPVYGPTPGVAASSSNPFPSAPIPGNFVEADGNPDYGNSFSYQLSGLTVGQEYQLSFYEAFDQQTPPFSGATTDQWIVGLGVAGSQFNITYGANNTSSYQYSDPSGSVTTPGVVNVPSQTFTGWQAVTVHLTADAANDVLTFLAWGDNGSTVNLPPIAFLDIANNGQPLAATPEPTSLTLMVLGMLGFGAHRLRRRRTNPATV